jgi:Holliday junction DNA helicase RuvB
MNASNETLRPKNFAEFIGQKSAITKLSMCLEGAKKRHEMLDHTLIYGPPGLGKTTLAMLSSDFLDCRLFKATGTNIVDKATLIELLSELEDNSTIFIDEIHGMAQEAMEILYLAMDEGMIEFNYKNQECNKMMRLEVPRFTLFGATTKPEKLTPPFRDRFGIVLELDYYSVEEIASLLSNYAKRLEIAIDDTTIKKLANISRGVPRMAINYLKRYRDFLSFSKNNGDFTYFLKIIAVDKDGLNARDIAILKAMRDDFSSHPRSLEAAASLLGFSLETLKEINEPFLVKEGYIERTIRGRAITSKGIEALKKRM